MLNHLRYFYTKEKFRRRIRRYFLAQFAYRQSIYWTHWMDGFLCVGEKGIRRVQQTKFNLLMIFICKFWMILWYFIRISREENVLLLWPVFHVKRQRSEFHLQCHQPVPYSCFICFMARLKIKKVLFVLKEWTGRIFIRGRAVLRHTR